MWEDVPYNQIERSCGSLFVVEDHSPGGRVQGSDYMYIDPSTCNPVDSWASKSLRAGMYARDYPLAEEAAHLRESVGFAQAFHDVQRAASDFLAGLEDVVLNREPRSSPRWRVPEVI